MPVCPRRECARADAAARRVCLPSAAVRDPTQRRGGRGGSGTRRRTGFFLRTPWRPSKSVSPISGKACALASNQIRANCIERLAAFYQPFQRFPAPFAGGGASNSGERCGREHASKPGRCGFDQSRAEVDAPTSARVGHRGRARLTDRRRLASARWVRSWAAGATRSHAAASARGSPGGYLRRKRYERRALGFPISRIAPSREPVSIGSGQRLAGILLAARVSDSLVGVDVDEAAVRWCQRHLRQVDSSLSLPAPDAPRLGSFELAFAASVFTHFTAAAVQCSRSCPCATPAPAAAHHAPPSSSGNSGPGSGRGQAFPLARAALQRAPFIPTPTWRDTVALVPLILIEPRAVRPPDLSLLTRSERLGLALPTAY